MFYAYRGNKKYIFSLTFWFLIFYTFTFSYKILDANWMFWTGEYQYIVLDCLIEIDIIRCQKIYTMYNIFFNDFQILKSIVFWFGIYVYLKFYSSWSS